MNVEGTYTNDKKRVEGLKMDGKQRRKKKEESRG